MANIFNSNQVHAGSFHVGNSKVSFGGSSTDHLTQSIQFQYAQQVQMIYELGSVPSAFPNTTNATSQNVYYAGGRASGTATLARVLTGRPATQDTLLTMYNDICNPQEIKIEMTASACLRDRNSAGAVIPVNTGTPAPQTTNTSVTTLDSAILQSLNGSIETQSAMFTQQMQFMFLNMQQT
jgi:hypothetical protein